jgi:hypothetical protein
MVWIPDARTTTPVTSDGGRFVTAACAVTDSTVAAAQIAAPIRFLLVIAPLDRCDATSVAP